MKEVAFAVGSEYGNAFGRQLKVEEKNKSLQSSRCEKA